MRRITAGIRTQGDRMAVFRQEFQIGSVGIVHEQRYTVTVADFRRRTQVNPPSQVIRRRQINRHIRFPVQFFLQRFRGYRTGQQILPRCRRKPVHFQVQQGGGSHQGMMGIPSGQQPCRNPLPFCGHQGEIQHAPDAQRRALRGINRAGSPEQGRGILLAPADDPFRAVQHVRSPDLRQVQRLRSCQRLSLVSRHVHTHRMRFRISPDKITDRRLHPVVPRRLPAGQPAA